MKMKDKLVKTNHKGSYYTMRKLSIVLLAVCSGAFIIAIPTYIVQNHAVGIAEENKTEKSESSSEEGQLEYEEYSDQEN